MQPEKAPTPFRYPVAGTANADVSLYVVDLAGERREVRWDRERFEYLVQVVWAAGNPVIAVQTRDQSCLHLLEVDPSTGSTTPVREVADSNWVDILTGTPNQTATGELVWIERDAEHDTFRLLVGGEFVTRPGLQVAEICSVSGSPPIPTRQGLNGAGVFSPSPSGGCFWLGEPGSGRDRQPVVGRELVDCLIEGIQRRMNEVGSPHHRPRVENHRIHERPQYGAWNRGLGGHRQDRRVAVADVLREFVGALDVGMSTAAVDTEGREQLECCVVPRRRRVIPGPEAHTGPAQGLQRNGGKLGERVPLRDQDRQRLMSYYALPQAVGLGEIAAETHVQTLGQEQRHRQLGTGVEAREELQIGRVPPGRGEHERRSEPGADHVDGQRRSLAAEFADGEVVQGEQFASADQELASRGRQLDATGGAVEQPDAEAVLQPADVAAERLLRDEEPLGGAAEVQFLRHDDEVPQQPDLEVVGHLTLLTHQLRE